MSHSPYQNKRQLANDLIQVMDETFIGKFLTYDTFAERPTARDFGVGSCIINGVVYNCDGMEWSPNNQQTKPKAFNILSENTEALPAVIQSTHFTSWSKTQLTGATVTISTTATTDDTAIIDVPLGGRGILSLTMTEGEQYGWIKDHTYVLTLNVVALTGTTDLGIRAVDENITAPILGTGRVGIIFTYIAGSTKLLRIGSGINAGATAGQVCTITIDNTVMIEDITGRSPQYFHSHVYRWGSKNTQPNYTLVDNVVTEVVDRNLTYATNPIDLIFVTGDSFSNGASDFPAQINKTSDYCAEAWSYSGGRLTTQIRAPFYNNITSNDYKAAVLQGGVNDINNSVTLAAMQKAHTEMCDICDGLGLPVVLVNVAPYVDIRSTSAKYSVWKQWNHWLETVAANRGYGLVDLVRIFDDPNSPGRMAQVYVTGTYTGETTYTGDVLHPNQAGQQLIADEVVRQLDKTLMAVKSKYTTVNKTYSRAVIRAQGIPMVFPSSGTMGNNGALSALTALDAAYTQCYMYFAADIIGAGVPAGWYYTIMSSTTAGTVYNNTVTPLQIPIVPASPTEFVTTGAGAYTGVVADTIVASIPIKANSMGINGSLVFNLDWSGTINSNVKSGTTKISSTTIGSASMASISVFSQNTSFKNRGIATENVATRSNINIGGSSASGSFNRTAIDTSADFTVNISSSRATAADNMVLQSAFVELITAN